MDPYKSSLSQDYLRALSIFKRKLQLLGFYPLVLNDDGLEYVSMDPYIIEDDVDDEMYKLLKKLKKEKKARKKSLKKKAKKSKKVAEAPVATTTVQPISNIVYYWPSQITTIVHPGQGASGTSTYQYSFDPRFGINDSSEENSSEADNDSNDQILKNDKEKPAKINYQTSFYFEGKSGDGDKQIRENTNQTLTSSTATSTTPFPLITVFPDPEEVVVQEIVDQQEIVNKISDNGKGNITKTSVKDHVDRTTKDSTTVHENVIETDTTVQVTEQVQVYEENPSNFQDTKIADKIPEKILPSESSTSVTPDITSIASIDVATESSAYSSKPPQPTPNGALQFFHETLPDEPHVPNGLPNLSKIVDNIPSSTDTSISEPITEIPENNTNIDGHRETDSQHSHYAVQLNAETATGGSAPQPLDEHLTPPKSIDNGTIHTELEVTIPINEIPNKSEGYSIDPKITRPIKVLDFVEDFESRSLTDNPVMVAVAMDDKSGRRSDVPIEADDVDEEDTTDNLAYNLTVDNLLEQSKVVENTSAETSTSAPVDASNYDNSDQFDGEIIPLIPIIIKQMKQGNVSPEEMEILKNSFGPFWPFIVEEASRESDSSEDMNPMLSELLNSVNRKIVKREATWGRPTYGRRLYLDDDDDDFEIVSRRRYYGGRRRPYRRYYQKK